MSAGRALILFDGSGGEYPAEIESLAKSSVVVSVGEKSSVDRESPLQVEMAIGISRGDRFDWVLQKATELGVARIAPLFTERVEVKLSGERLQKKIDHWRQVIISACEQSQRTSIPNLCTPQSLSSWLESSSADVGLVLHHRTAQQLSSWQTPPQSVRLLIGPEGGLSDDEIQRAEACGLSPLSLGPRVLRTETAPIAALSVLQFQWGDF